MNDECHGVITEHVSLWCYHEKEHICVRLEQPLHGIECTWTPFTEFNDPLNLFIAYEHLRVSIDHALDAIEYGWTPLSIVNSLNTH